MPRSVTVNRIADAVLGALAQAVAGEGGGSSLRRADRRVVWRQSIRGPIAASCSTRATAAGNGRDPCTVTARRRKSVPARRMPMNIPVEAIEIDYPIRNHAFTELVPDSGGAGQFRGGLGLLREYEMLAEEASINVRGDRTIFPAARRCRRPWTPTRPRIFWKTRMARSGRYRAKYSDRNPAAATASWSRTAGGGGYGDPRLRDRVQNCWQTSPKA